MIRRFYNAVIVPTVNFLCLWLGRAGVCVGLVVLLVWAAGVPR
jgi:hypothetical protein